MLAWVESLDNGRLATGASVWDRIIQQNHITLMSVTITQTTLERWMIGNVRSNKLANGLNIQGGHRLVEEGDSRLIHLDIHFKIN